MDGYMDVCMHGITIFVNSALQHTQQLGDWLIVTDTAVIIDSLSIRDLLSKPTVMIN